MNKLIWKTEKQQQRKLWERRTKKKTNSKLSGDGHVLAAEGTFQYKGINYLVQVLRYYTLSDGFKPMMSGRKSGYHAVVEFPEETKWLKNLAEDLGMDYEFLYHDTLHFQHDKMNKEEQIEDCHRVAKDDIDRAFTDFPTKIGKIYPDLSPLAVKLNKIAKEHFEEFI